MFYLPWYEDPDIRKLGYEEILLPRDTYETIDLDSENVRLYKHPQIQFHCENYYEMVDWNSPFTEPPFTRNISYGKLIELVESAVILDERDKRPKFDSKKDFV